MIFFLAFFDFFRTVCYHQMDYELQAESCASMFLLFLLLWIVLNGKITTEVFLLGIALAVPVYLFFCLVMKYSPKKEWKMLRRLPWLFRYIAILLWEIVKANFAVIHLILSAKLEPEPVLFRFRKPLKMDTHKVLLANSITLTPGTITVDVNEKDEYLVHALDKDLAEGIEDSVFVRMIEEVEAEL